MKKINVHILQTVILDIKSKDHFDDIFDSYFELNSRIHDLFNEWRDVSVTVLEIEGLILHKDKHFHKTGADLSFICEDKDENAVIDILKLNDQWNEMVSILEAKDWILKISTESVENSPVTIIPGIENCTDCKFCED